MDSENPISVLLRTARESARLSVAELSKLTSIRTHVINAIDEGRFADLPQVYMRSFIRSYAKTVKINEQEIEHLMNTHLAELTKAKHSNSTPISPPKNIPPPQKQQSKPAVPVQNRNLAHIGETKSSHRLKWILGVFALLATSVAAYFMYFKQPSNPNAIQPGSLPPGVVGTKDSTGTNNSGGGLLNYFGVNTTASADSIILEANAIDTSWISITIDGKRNEQVTLMPQTSKRWSGMEKLVLSVGNAGGVTLVRNGTPLPVLGKRGETVRMVRVTRNEFVTSATPNKPKIDTARKKTTLTPTTNKAPQVVPKQQPSTQPKEQPRAQVTPKPVPSTTKPATSASQQTAGTQSALHTKPQQTKPVISNSTPVTTSTVPKPQTPKPGTTTGVTTVNGKPAINTLKPTTPTATTTPKPKPSVTAKEAAEAKKRRDEMLKRARQLDITPVDLKPITPKEEKKPATTKP